LYDLVSHSTINALQNHALGDPPPPPPPEGWVGAVGEVGNVGVDGVVGKEGGVGSGCEGGLSVFGGATSATVVTLPS
jgi:hypothetical protein